jgi:hypothetical protein
MHPSRLMIEHAPYLTRAIWPSAIEVTTKLPAVDGTFPMIPICANMSVLAVMSSFPRTLQLALTWSPVAGSVVTHSVEDNCVAIGVPARMARRDVAWTRDCANSLKESNLSR